MTNTYTYAIALMTQTYAKRIGVKDGDRVNMKITKEQGGYSVYFQKDENGSEKIEIIRVKVETKK